MYKGKKILALIPARGGSKGLPRKNVRNLCGKPLIAWTIEQAKKSKYLDKIIVSTDNEEISSVSRQYGAEVPFIRPKELATDTAKMVDVIKHGLDWLKDNSYVYDIFVLLQPSSPLRLDEDIDKSLELLFSKDALAIVSVCEVDGDKNLVNSIPENGNMKDFIDSDTANRNRQEFPQFYRLNGAVYLAYPDYLRKQNSFFGAATFAYIMPRERSIDINTEIDFQFVEFLLQK